MAPGAEYVGTEDGHTGSEPVIVQTGKVFTVTNTVFEANDCVALFWAQVLLAAYPTQK